MPDMTREVWLKFNFSLPWFIPGVVHSSYQGWQKPLFHHFGEVVFVFLLDEKPLDFWKIQHPSISSLLHIYFLYPFLESKKQLY